VLIAVGSPVAGAAAPLGAAPLEPVGAAASADFGAAPVAVPVDLAGCDEVQAATDAMSARMAAAAGSARLLALAVLIMI
jgi:hypothetical protein